jgi:Holliday junction resolvase
MTPEGKIQAKILSYLKGLNECWAVKVIECNMRGCPDIIACINGKFYAFEVKSFSGKLSPSQKTQGKRITRAGGQWYVVTSVDQVKEILGCH